MDHSLPVGLYVGVPSIDALVERAVGKFVVKKYPREAWVAILSCHLRSIRIMRWYLPPSVDQPLVEAVGDDLTSILEVLGGPRQDVPDGMELAMCLAAHHDGQLGSVLIPEMTAVVARELATAVRPLIRTGAHLATLSPVTAGEAQQVTVALNLLLAVEYFRARVREVPRGGDLVAGITTHIHRGIRQIIDDYTALSPIDDSPGDASGQEDE